MRECIDLILGGSPGTMKLFVRVSLAGIEPVGFRVLRVICVTIKQSYNRGCTIAWWLRRSLFAKEAGGDAWTMPACSVARDDRRPLGRGASGELPVARTLAWHGPR